MFVIELIKNWKSFHFIYILFFLIPINADITKFVLIFWFLISLPKTKFSKSIYNKDLLPLVLLFIMLMCSLFYTEVFNLKYFDYKIPLLLLPITFWINSVEKYKIDVKKILLYFVYGCLFSIIICYTTAIYNSIDIVNFKLIIRPTVNANQTFFESATKDGNYFFGDLFSTTHQSVYFAMILSFAIASLLFLDIAKKKQKYIYIIIFTVTIGQISSRAGLATLFLVFVFYFFSILNFKKATIALIISCFTFGVMIILSPRLKYTASTLINKGIDFDNEDKGSFSQRIMTWKASTEVIQENPIIGVGIGDAYEELRKVYRNNRYIYPYQQRLNAHNQYLQLYVECGILGLGLFLLSVSYLLKPFAEKKLKHLAICFFIIISFNSLFESILNRSTGMLFFCLIFCFLLTHKKVLLNTTNNQI